MKLQANIYYWSVGPGHVAVQINDLDHSKTDYISYSRATSLELDQLTIGDPYVISLPEIVTNNNFKAQYQASSYYFDENLNSNLLAHYIESYHFLSNNCAHAVQEVLMFAGYLQPTKPRPWGLLPYHVAMGGIHLGLSIIEAKLKDLHAENKDEEVNLWLALSKDRLKLQHDQSYLRISFGSVKYIEDFDILNAIVFQSLDNLQSIKDLINASRLVKTTRLKDDLTHYLNLVDKTKYHQAVLELEIAAMKSESKTLQDLGYHEDAAKANKLIEVLEDNSRKFFVQRSVSYREFKITCGEAIKQAKPDLDKHGEWQKLLATVCQVIMNIGTNVVNPLFSYKNTGFFNFFKRPNIGKHLDAIQHSLDDEIEEKNKVKSVQNK